MKKLTLTLLIGLFGATCILAQAPQAFKYQTVIRDNSGELIINQPVSIRIEILKDSIIGTPLYSEIHSKTTNQFGLITIDIGAGTVESGIFEYISWGTSFHFLKIELDETGNSNYQLMGISQLLSVPYALNSGSLTLTDVNGQSYTLGVDTLGNLTTITQFKTCGEDTLQDPRDFQKYPTVQIGSQCWMAKNLNIGTMVNGSIYQSINDTIEKYCFYNDTAYCDTYGGLYQWDEMMQYMTTEGIQGICPDGWHIPTDVEWCTLENYVDDFLVPCNLFGWRGYTAGAHLKEAGWDHWSVPNQGYNSYGFTALPGGYYMPGNSFNTLHNNAYFWSSSDNGVIAAGRGLNHITPYVFRGYEPKSNGYSVRCLWNGGGIGENALPAQPTDPTPPDGAIDQFTSISLSWSCTDPDGDPLSYSVYFGETNPPPSVGGGVDTTFNPGALNYNTTYYWKIVASDGTHATEGNIWSFTTHTGGFICGDILTDFEGNNYNTVLINNQCWMEENLKATAYSNGTPIPNVTDNTEWYNLTSSAYAWYDNNILWKNEYGALYNWFATVDANGLCPTGWHVPTNDEWTALTDFIGGVLSPHGNELKSCRQVNSPLGGNCNTLLHPRWDEHITHYGTDDYGFSGLPGGIRIDGGIFSALGTTGDMWTSTENSSSNAWFRILGHDDDVIYVYSHLKQSGFSVRCIRD